MCNRRKSRGGRPSKYPNLATTKYGVNSASLFEMTAATRPIPATRGTRMSAEARRTTIVIAASELFAKVGYQRCRMSDVANRVGVTASARKGMRRVADALADLLAEGQATGEIRASLDPAAAAWWLLSLIASQRFRAALMPSRGRLDPQLAAITLAAITTTTD